MDVSVGGAIALSLSLASCPLRKSAVFSFFEHFYDFFGCLCKKSQPSCFVQGREFLQNRRDFIARNRKHVHLCKRGNATRGFHTNCTLQTGKTFSKTSMDRNVHKDFSFEGMRKLSRNLIVATQNPKKNHQVSHTQHRSSKMHRPLNLLDGKRRRRKRRRKEGRGAHFPVTTSYLLPIFLPRLISSLFCQLLSFSP